MLTQARLKEICTYDPETGLFVGTVNRGKKYKAGNPFCSMNKDGYLETTIDSKKYMAHRLAWLYVYGEFPDDQIDHKNTIRNDNRIENLRIANRHEQMRNKSVSSVSKSGVKGVYFCKVMKKWRARLTIDHKDVFNAYYGTLEEAKAAMSLVRSIHHGAFARD